jgi:hypothetical protein
MNVYGKARQNYKLLITQFNNLLQEDDLLENQGKKRSEMAPLERSWRWGRTF